MRGCKRAHHPYRPTAISPHHQGQSLRNHICLVETLSIGRAFELGVPLTDFGGNTHDR